MDVNNNVYQELLKSIEHWNEYRVPILRISQPDKNLNFQGAMRFYFQDSGQKVATKCVSVTSADTTKDVIDVLIEKFRPDMRMLSVPEYGLYEIHENGDERKLEPGERPLLVQLEWNNDDLEGRFLLRRMDEKTRELASPNEEPSLKRKLSKKEKKKREKMKKQQQKDQEKADAAANKLASKGKNGIAQRLYNELPETSFTRSISNPEAVMKRRRAQKLEKRLQEFSNEGGQDAGGTLRIFGETINKDVSYKTLLLSTKDTAATIVKQILEKYGKDDEDPNNYCLVQLIVPHSATSGGDNNSVQDLNTSAALKESILDDQDCPLLISLKHDKSRGILTFHIRHKPADYLKRRKKKPSKAQIQPNPLHPFVVQQLNQRLQINRPDEYSNQNSPQNSSQTSGSTNQEHGDLLPPPFKSINSMPPMYPTSNNGNPVSYQQPHSMSTSTLPSRISADHQNIPGMNGTIQRQNYSHPNMINNHQHGRQFVQNQMVHSNNNGDGYPVAQPQVPQQYLHTSGANDQILPALIQVKEEVEDIFLNNVITCIKPTDTVFKLAPTYVLYMVSRYRASTLFHPELQAPSRAELFVPFTKKIATIIRNTIEMHIREPVYLAFWLANSSDLSHFYKQDKHLSHFTIDAQDILYDSIRASFKYLLSCKQMELDGVLHTFFGERDDHDYTNGASNNRINPNDSSVSQILDVLNETMAIMRKNRVNAALTIQIFSHLFHHISKWLFDRLIGVYDQQSSVLNSQPNFALYCTPAWGERLHRRLAMIGYWAEKQGLEQAADFHLARVTQVTLFLARKYPPKISQNDLGEACESCDRLNPVQLRALLQRYQPDIPILHAIIQKVLYQMDHRYMAADQPLEEDRELNIPFIIPDDGYSSEMIRYIPNGLLDFVSYLSKLRVREEELCIFTVQPTSSGHWTVYFKNHQADTPEVIVIQLRKMNNSMGLSIIAAKGVGQERLGIYIKNVVKNGAAAMDGRLQAGDQLLEVDGNSLLDITQETAAELMQRTGALVTLRIAKQAAIYHNLSDIINSVPSQTVMSPPSIIPANFVPLAPPMGKQQQHIQPDRRLLPPPEMHKSTQPVDRFYPHPPPPEMPQHTRSVQFQPNRNAQNQILPQMQKHQDNRLSSQIQQVINNSPVSQQMSERQIHFQPPPPIVSFSDQQIPGVINPTSPLKSPKKVSWVDTQPHQSLHTLIPPSPAPMPSPTAQAPSPPPEIPSPPSQLEDSYDDSNQNYLQNQHGEIIKDSNHLTDVSYLIMQNGDNEEEDEYDDEEIDEDIRRDGNQHPDTTKAAIQPSSNGQTNSSANQQQPGSGRPTSATNGLEAATESLTIEDIDEVLSSPTHNNWLEESAGVIGTQEVYNDPRHKIIRERERPNNNDENIEELSIKEKIKMFSAKK